MKIRILKPFSCDDFTGMIVDAALNKYKNEARFFYGTLSYGAFNLPGHEPNFEIIEEQPEKSSHEWSMTLTNYSPTRREYFAAKAMNAFCKHVNIYDHLELTSCCERSLKFADEMIRILDESPKV